jgi:glyoxylase-like metal-dependent hydrolase (beta-lactamase superfamily II)
MPIEITTHVSELHVDLKWFPQPYPPNVYLVRDGDEAAIVDSGFGDDDSFNARSEALAGLQLKYIIITHHHYDHSSGAHRLREATGARIVVHRKEEDLLLNPKLETGDMEITGDSEEQQKAREMAKKWRDEAAKATPDVRVEDGEILTVGDLRLRSVHAPGHTDGHLCLFLEQERLLFAGDNVLGVGTAAIAPPPHGDMAEYVRSLKKMQSLDAALLAPGHGPMVKEPNRKLQELIDHRQQREDQILGLIAKGKADVKSLVKAIYPELDKRLLQMATGQAISHLHKLQSEGKLKLEGEGAETKVAS